MPASPRKWRFVGGSGLRIWSAVVALAAAASDFDGQTAAQAQYSMGSRSGSSFGNQTFGNQSFGNQPFGNQMFGNQSFGNQSFGGNQPFGNQSFGNQSFGNQSFGNQSFGNQSFGNQSFGNQSFGNQPFGNQSSWSGSSFGSSGFRSPRQTTPTTPTAPASQNRSSIRTTFRADFDYPQASAEKLSTSLARRLTAAPAIQAQTPIQVLVQGRTALLRGVVATEHGRALAERMALLEPGIEAVKNEVVVADRTPPAPATS